MDKEEQQSLPLKIITDSIPSAVSCFDYEYQVNASGGKPPYVWLTGKGIDNADPSGPDKAASEKVFTATVSEKGKITGFPYGRADELSHKIVVILEDSDGVQVFKTFPISIINSGLQCGKALSGSGSEGDIGPLFPGL